jgi:hypothetical protein
MMPRGDIRELLRQIPFVDQTLPGFAMIDFEPLPLALQRCRLVFLSFAG